MAESVIMQETASDSRSQTPEDSSPGLPVRSMFGQEFRLICPICLKDLKGPRQLMGCFHIFCTDCLRTFPKPAENDKISCPLPSCRKAGPQEISSTLDSDIYLTTLSGCLVVNAESGNVCCSNSSHGESKPVASVTCLDCKKNLCDVCRADHNEIGSFRNHCSLRLFQWPTTLTYGISRMRNPHTRDVTFNCPICRNTDTCEHEQWLKDLSKKDFLENDRCLKSDHASNNQLIAYCKVCLEPVCALCSMIKHKNHETIDLTEVKEEKLLELKRLKKELEFKLEIFEGAYKSAEKEADYFEYHVQETTQEMTSRKGQVINKVEDCFKTACSLVEQTGQKQAELNRQSAEMLKEVKFLETAVHLAEALSDKTTPALAVVRAYKGLEMIMKAMLGEDTKDRNDLVLPQLILEKRLVLPAPNCMKPDLKILEKVGVESTSLRKSFVLKETEELLQYYSILPLTQTDALVSYQPEPFKSAVVQYSYNNRRQSIDLPESGQYSIIAVPGNGIVATLYKAERIEQDTRKEVLFWDQALDRSIKKHEAMNAGANFKSFATTALPPRGLAVTRDNHLVICTSEDPKKGSQDRNNGSIILMTMRGDVIKEKSLVNAVCSSSDSLYFPRYVTVNINGDICVTDAVQRVIYIFDDDLNLKLTVKNPYKDDKLNKEFNPMGICHDSFGRLIIADGHNHCVLRIVVDERGDLYWGCKDEETGDLYQANIILANNQNEVKDLNYPALVALGPGPRLWVVCKDNIQVFDYMDKE